jgi:hypothetical protein
LCSITQLCSITPLLRSTIIPLPCILLPCPRSILPLRTDSYFFLPHNFFGVVQVVVRAGVYCARDARGQRRGAMLSLRARGPDFARLGRWVLMRWMYAAWVEAGTRETGVHARWVGWA